MLSTLVVGTAAIFLMVMASEHYLRHVPASEHVWWMWLVLAGSGALALGPPAVVIKARQLNRLYLQAVAAQSG